MENLNGHIKDELLCKGAALVGYADLTVLPPEKRRDMPYGISVAAVYPKETIRGIADMPTKEYLEQYNALNERLDALAVLCAEKLRGLGHNAFAQTRDAVGFKDGGYGSDMKLETVLPHKTVARLAGLGWIGKSALLVTKEFGSMVRITSVLTDAPLITAGRVLEPKCGDCKVCTNACPGGVIKGENWSPKQTSRDEIFDARACKLTALERMERSVGIKNLTICGRCINVCPYTQRYLNS